MDNSKIKFRQPIYKDGKFFRWHYWGYAGFRGEFVAPVYNLNSDSGYTYGNSYPFVGIREGMAGTGREIYECDFVTLVERKPHYDIVEKLFILVKFSRDSLCWNIYLPHEDFVYWVIKGNEVENPEMAEKGAES